jgi:hypothetical protein
MDVGFDFPDVVDEVVARAGGETATAQDILKIRRGIRILSERWLAQGYNTWRIDTMIATVPGTTPVIGLPSHVDDIIQINSIRWNTRSETPMKRMTPDEYAQMTTKLTKGLPTQYWLQRTEKPKLHVYPVGSSENSDSLAITFIRRPEDYDRYDDVDDTPGRWLEAYVTGLALDLARKRPPFDEALIGRLKAEASEAEELAQAGDRDRSNYRFHARFGY